MEKKELIKLMLKPFTDPVTMFYAFALLALYVIVPQNCFAALPWETCVASGIVPSLLTFQI